MNQKITFQAAGKSAALYPAKISNAPFVVLNHYAGDGQDVAEALESTRAPACHLLCISELQWDHDMSPWYCPPLSADDEPCTGGADAYLDLLLSEILPLAFSYLEGEPESLFIAGYSLAGLFALYALYKTDRFSRAASMSGSLWFPDFREFAASHTPLKMPEKIYLSLGEKEPKVSNPMLQTVGENTLFLAEHYRGHGIDTEFEWNPGNHYKDATARTAKGIAKLLK